MSKEELEQILILKGVEFKTKRDLKLTIDAVVSAYNRAIEDVEKLSYLSESVLNEEGQFTRIIEERDLEQLKIKD